MARNVEDIRNIAVCGHGSSGKTTLVDHLLVKTGAVSGQPKMTHVARHEPPEPPARSRGGFQVTETLWVRRITHID